MWFLCIHVHLYQMKLLEIYLVTLNVCALNKWKCGSIVKTVLLSQKMNSFIIDLLAGFV